MLANGFERRSYANADEHPFGPHSPLHEQFLNELARMKNSEKKLTLALPLVAAAASAQNLKELVESHLIATKGHAETIEQIEARLGEKLPRKSSSAMSKLIKQVVKLMARKRKSPQRDHALIAAAQKIEHYEIAAYGTLCAWAKELGCRHELAQLKSILDQEKLADTLLTAAAQSENPLPELARRVVVRKLKKMAAA
jgi:ferritin-like metal-binding protein YciE